MPILITPKRVTFPMQSFQFMFWELKVWPTSTARWENSVELHPTGHIVFDYSFFDILIKLRNLSHYDAWLQTCYLTKRHVSLACTHMCKSISMQTLEQLAQSSWAVLDWGLLSLVPLGNQLRLAKCSSMEALKAEGWPSPWPSHALMKHSHM